MDPLASVTVLGTPGPQGSKSFMGLTPAGHAKMRESSRKVKPWRTDVVEAVLAAYGCRCPDPTCRVLDDFFPLDGPLSVSMVFTLRKPVSAPKRRRTWPSGKPDLSKLVRATEDALTTSGLWKDDARVVDYRRLAKVYPDEDPDSLPVPGVVIKIWSLAATLETPVGLVAALPTRGPDRAKGVQP